MFFSSLIFVTDILLCKLIGLIFDGLARGWNDIVYLKNWGIIYHAGREYPSA